MGVAASSYTAVLPKGDLPYDTGQQIASTVRPLESDPTSESARQEVFHFVRGTLFAALFSLPFWICVVIWVLR
jgi:uncharacterized membrane protein